MTYRILQLAAGVTAHPARLDMLHQATAGFRNWDQLLDQAESHGMAPLLYRHLNPINACIPDDFQKALKLLLLRHRRANTIRMEALNEVLSLLDAEGIATLVLKGAALCRLIYPEIGLRPMRDIDILVRKRDACLTQEILVMVGYKKSTKPFPPDHYHLPPLERKIDGLSVSIEIHHGLYPDCPPYYRQPSFDQLFQSATAFDMGGFTARTLNQEEMLLHLYQHGFIMPLIYEPFRLISAADIVSVVELESDKIDWKKIHTKEPKLITALAQFHHLTPWHPKVLTRLALKPGPYPKAVGQPFAGWPRVRLSGWNQKRIFGLFRDTLFPPQWWFKIYYGISGRIQWLRCLLVTHPRHLMWWVRLYGGFFSEFHLKAAGVCTWNLNRSLAARIRNIQIIVAALVRKLRN